MNKKYTLTERGKEIAEKFITECKIKRQRILEIGKDTAKETILLTIKDIESDVNLFGIDSDGEYFNCWGITDNFNSRILSLKLGVDFMEV